MSELEQDFKEVIAQVNAKLEESARALRVANELAKKAGFQNGLINSQWVREKEETPLNEEDFEDDEAYYEACDKAYEASEAKYAAIDVSALETAMEEAGWSASSSYC